MFNKKLFFALALIATSFVSNAQKLKKGTNLIGGNISYLNVEGGEALLASIPFSKMLSNSFALGGNLTYVNYGGRTSSLIVGPQAKYYFNGEKALKPYLIGNLGVDLERPTLGYGAGVGLANFLNDYVSIDLTATYGTTTNYASVYTASSRNTFLVQVGFQIYLPKK